ncbi:H+ Antiporter protein [Variovorax sp. PBL-H6]|uniref:MFS transporter n=1 Tax=Variovorax sp. PBL-H6 TaxID=434009 RepID=UPI0013194D83|nr:MFS transporter [Variovorax sp. PBL-H6]VTU31932.1 H+ Antiporter protein [Variovorax sp. PBL-H6]
MALREVGIPHRLIALLVLGHVAFTGSRFTLTLHAVALHASPFAIGLLMGLIMVLPMLLAVRVGRWCDRTGYARPTAIGFTMLAASGLVAGLVPTMPGLYVASVLTGSGYMLAHVAMNNAIGQASPASLLTQSFSWLTMGFSLSGIVGPLVAGFLIDHLGHPAAFLFLPGFTVAGLLLLAMAHSHHSIAPRGAPAASESVRDLVLNDPLRTVFIVTGVLSMGWDLFMFLAPLHAVRSGLSATGASLVMGAYGVGTFAIRLALPRLTRDASLWRTLSAAMFMTAICYVLFPLAATLPLLLLAAFAMGLALGCGQPMAMSLLYVTVPASRAGEAVGVRSTITSASQTVLPLVFGGLGSALGVAAVFWIGALVMAWGGTFANRRR